MVVGGVWEVVNLLDVSDVVPLERVSFSFPGLIAYVCDAACAREVDEEAGGDLFEHPCEDGVCAAGMVDVSLSVVSTESAMLQDGPGARRNSRMTISASSDSFAIMSEALKSPTAIFICGYLCLNSMDGERRRAVICREGYFLTIPSRTLPPMKPVAPVLQTWLVNESAGWS